MARVVGEVRGEKVKGEKMTGVASAQIRCAFRSGTAGYFSPFTFHLSRVHPAARQEIQT